MGAPPKVWPLPKALVPVLLPEVLVPGLLLKGLELPGVVPEVPEAPEESVPVLPGADAVPPYDDVVPPNEDVVPPNEDVLPKELVATPEFVPGAVFPVVVAALLLCRGWLKRPIGLICASPR
jgi:hypothetical protein